jgi:hypothetical protein
MKNSEEGNLALIASLAERSPSGFIGRTALMKFFYFLQCVRQVPLGYNFTLHSYGPFDRNVLDHLDHAEAFGAVKSNVVYYPGGYGYEIRPGDQNGDVKKLASEFLNQHDADINWVISEFGNLDSANLELESTIVYVDREAARNSETLSDVELIRRVSDVKPRFALSTVRDHLQSLKQKKLLLSVTAQEAEKVPA